MLSKLATSRTIQASLLQHLVSHRAGTNIRRDLALSLLREHRDDLTRLHVKSLSLFGSVARDQAKPDSDVDILVEFDAPVGLFTFIEVKLTLEDILGCPVDLGIPG